MTIKSDLKQLQPDFDYDSSFISWLKHSQTKLLTLSSLGIFWDFRNEKSDPKNEAFIDEMLKIFTDDIDNLFVCRNGCYLNHKYRDEKFWVANKYYAWKLENVAERGNYHLTVKQISKLNKILMFVEKRDDSISSLV